METVSEEVTPKVLQEKRCRGRPRKHADAKAASRVASQAYRDRRKTRREAPTISSNIIDLSAVAAYKIRK